MTLCLEMSARGDYIVNQLLLFSQILQYNFIILPCSIDFKRNGKLWLQLFSFQKADDKFFVCKWSKSVKFKLYHVENSKTKRQTV